MDDAQEDIVIVNEADSSVESMDVDDRYEEEKEEELDEDDAPPALRSSIDAAAAGLAKFFASGHMIAESQSFEETVEEETVSTDMEDPMPPNISSLADQALAEYRSRQPVQIQVPGKRLHAVC